MAIYPEAKYRELPRFKTPMKRYARINIHTAVSNSEDIYGTFAPEGASAAHFYLNKNGGVIQYVDTSFMAGADYDANDSTISIETWDGYKSDVYPIGAEVPPFNSDQIKGLVALLVWIYQAHPEIRVSLATDSMPGPTSEGVSWHRLGAPYRTNLEATKSRVPTAYKDGYLKKGGIWYSSVSGKICPGDNKIAQMPEIFSATAKFLTGTAPVPLPELPATPQYTIEYIKEIQGLLNKTGLTLVVDGDFGAYTKSAVSDFQKENGLYVDGDPGPLTYAKLQEITTFTEAPVSAVVRNIDPYPGRVTSHFSTRRKNPATGKWSAHLGTDIAPVPGGTRNRPVRSFQGGTVTAAGWGILAGRSGNGVIVEHVSGFRTYYGHLDRVNVRKGDKVAAGTTLGVGGTTGNVTGVHLHFEMHYLRGGKWVAVNPFVEAKRYGITLGAGGAAGQVSVAPGGNDNDRRIQTALKGLGFYGGLVDGIKGPLQVTAVKSFQAYVGHLVADGDWGAKTQERFETLGRPSSRAALDAALNPVQSGTQDNRNIQTALKNLGLYNGVIDGIEGPMQKSAVSEFQRLTGLVADGDWGGITQAKFEALGRPGSRSALNAAVAPAAVIRKGSVRSEVGQIQQALRNRNYNKQTVDNNFGNQTDANVKDFQRRNGLVVDGIVSVGGPTWRALGL